MPPQIRRLLPLLAQMNESGRTLSLAEAANVAALSPHHLQRIFTGQLGESPKQYQRRVNLEVAAIELRASEDRIIDIAMANGFQSHEAFTRAFSTHYGTSPSEYRKRSPRISGAARNWTAGSSPCVRLYGVTSSKTSVKPTSKDHVMTSPDITREHVDTTPTLVARRRVDRDHLADAFAECLPAAFGYAIEAGLRMAGPPFVRYLNQSAAFFEIEAGVPLVEPATSVEAPDLFASELPGGEAVAAIHVGPYDSLGDTHIALDRWMAEHELTPSGGPWEIYLTDPGEVPDPNEWQTKVIWPLT